MLKNIACDAYLNLIDRGSACSRIFGMLLNFKQGGQYLPECQYRYFILKANILVERGSACSGLSKQDKMVLMGHSFGTLVAMFYYMKYPEHVKGIILTATMAPYISEDKPFSEMLKEIHKRCEDLRTRPEVTTELANAGLSNGSELSPRQRSDKYKITGLASFNMFNIANWRKFKGGAIYYNPLVDNAVGESIPDTYDIRPTLHMHPVPITIIQGDKDYIDPSAGYWTSVFSDYDFVKLNVVKNASHYSWLDDKLKFDESLRQAIDRMKN